MAEAPLSCFCITYTHNESSELPSKCYESLRRLRRWSDHISPLDLPWVLHNLVRSRALMTVPFQRREHPPVFVATTDLFLFRLTFQWFAQCCLKLGRDRSQQTWWSLGWLMDEAVQDCGGWLWAFSGQPWVAGICLPEWMEWPSSYWLVGGASQLWCDLIYLVLGGQDRV